VKVIGTLPKVDGPTHVLREGETAQSTFAPAATLPYNFSFTNVSYGVESARFTTTKSSVCVDIAVHAVTNPGAALGGFAITLKRDVSLGTDPSLGQVTTPRDGVARSYCFSGTSSGNNYYMTFGFGSGGGTDGVYEYVNGNGTIRNP
jgi:hypothetical protein